VTSLSFPLICVVTPGRGVSEPLIQAIAAAARAGASLVHVRERALDDRQLLALVRRAVDVTRGTRAAVVVNDRVDVALAAGAAGVHLREDSVAASRVRTIVPERFVIGRSVHSVEEARRAEESGGCDYLVFGTVFASRSKPPGHAVAGVETLKEVCAAVALPVVAIGGVTLARVGELVDAGAAGIAAIDLFADPERAGEAVAAARRQFDTRS